MPRRRSPIWTTSQKDFHRIIQDSTSLSDALRQFGLRPAGGNFKTLKARIRAEGLDTSHLVEGAKAAREAGRQKGNRGGQVGKPLEQIMVRNSTYSRSSLKKRLLRDGVLHNRCEECGQGSTWKNRPLTMVLDHINGDATDHRRENLRMLCPNCNSQQNTFAGRNQRNLFGKPLQPRTKVCGCGAPIGNQTRSGLCRSCASRKSARPSVMADKDPEVVAAQVRNLGFRGTAAIYGVSDTTIRKWVNRWGVV